MRPKKSLGQHYLRSERALNSIIEAGDPNPGDLILEIGPGEGVLTQKLLACGGQVVAVEKDDYLYAQLKEKFKKEIESGKLKLIHGDILEVDLSDCKLQAHNYKLIANIPYNITGAILEKFLSADYQPTQMVLLVQKEVAERIAARDGKESILSLSVKAYGTPRYVEKVLAGSFVPTPAVDSAIISIEKISKSFFVGFFEEDFFTLLKAGFSSKRKKLSSNLANLYPKEAVISAFQALNLDENIRAEDLSIEKWGNLALSFVNQRS